MEADMLDRFHAARVLVVDDNPANLALLEAVLARAGVQHIHTTTDPRAALSRFDEIDPDIVLLDLHMPHLSGYAVLEEIARRAAGSYLPVLVLTADTTREAIHRALGSGARDFVTKPFDAAEVTLRVHNLLETRYLYATLRQHNARLHEQLTKYQEIERAEEESRQLKRDRIAGTIRDELFHIVFQPIIDIATRTVVGCEALTRFTAEPLRGPDRWFIEATEVGLGTELELATMRHAIQALDDFAESVFLALNVSAATLLSNEFPAMLDDSRSRTRVVLELTEHVPVENYDVVHVALADPRGRGVRLAVDDTGAGYAGFQHLLSLKPDVIKLDSSLTRGVDVDPVRHALAAALVSFTDQVGAGLVAEGIESSAELAAVEKLGIRWVQGYHLARPQPLAQLAAAFPGITDGRSHQPS
jgi:EAL domain-containing protein (putative c-di-GMP-specific phosphodiesterase class I)/AmiR/NasT family two-component response regulator